MDVWLLASSSIFVRNLSLASIQPVNMALKLVDIRIFANYSLSNALINFLSEIRLAISKQILKEETLISIVPQVPDLCEIVNWTSD